MMPFFSDLHDRWARDRASCLIRAWHDVLIGVVALSFDAGHLPPPPCVMEGRDREKPVWRKMLRSNWSAEQKPHRGNMCSQCRQHVFFLQGCRSGKLLQWEQETSQWPARRSSSHGHGGDAAGQAVNRAHKAWRSMQACGCGVSQEKQLTSFAVDMQKVHHAQGGPMCAQMKCTS